MVLLQIHPKCVTLLEPEGNAPWTIHMDRVTWWSMTAQPVKIESRKVEVGRRGRRIQRIKHQ